MADKKRDPQMEQLFIELRQAIASDFDGRFEAMESRLDAKLDAKFAEQERRLTERLTVALTDHLTGVVVRQLETAEQHLEDRLKVYLEELRGLVINAAEGYGGTLEKIERELIDMNKRFDTRLLDHDKALANHNQRLLVLERRRSGRRAKPRS